MIPKLTPAAKANLIKLTTAMGSKLMEHHAAEISQVMIATIADEKQADEPRLAAARQIVELQPDDAPLRRKCWNRFRRAARRSSPPAFSMPLAAVNRPPLALPCQTHQHLDSAGPRCRLRVLLSRQDSTRVFLEAVEKGKMQFTDMTLNKSSLAAHPDSAIAARAKV